MDDYYVPASSSSPEIDFKFSQNTLSIKGESYPENAAAFYGPILSSLKCYLGSLQEGSAEINVELKYFNSSSTKILLNLFEILNNSVLAGNKITLNWYYHEDDDTILEFGEDLYSDFGSLTFNPIAVTNA